MKQSIILLWVVFTSLLTYANETDCVEAQSKANYVLLHTKKALKADNFDHQKYFAKRAIKVFEETRNLMKSCGCENAESAIYDGIQNLEKAIDPLDWDKGRFYTQKAVAYAEDLISALDNCTMGNNNNYSEPSSVDASSATIHQKEIELLEAQQQLIKKQQQLLLEQQQLKIKLDQQKQERAIELEQQKRLKTKAEFALDNFEKSILELTQVLDCKDAYALTFESFKRAEKVLASESLSSTKKYYAERAKDIAAKAMRKLQDCNN